MEKIPQIGFEVKFDENLSIKIIAYCLINSFYKKLLLT